MMESEKEFNQKTYDRHTEHYRQYTAGNQNEGHAKAWLDGDTVDTWRHSRMYQLLDPILVTEPGAKWLTVGDGRYGVDAKYILDHGGEALASDISDLLLKEAQQAGYIPRYQKENAESLSFEGAVFDYVLCKEAYHHFPRPMVALYEMLRVASKGVVLIEPNDHYINDSMFQTVFRNMKIFLKLLLGMDASKHGYEDSGNYVYRISKREIEKVALGLNYRVVAFKGINDAFLSGVEKEKMSANGPLQKKIKALIGVANFLCRMGIANHGLLAAIIFKKTPSDELQRRLRGQGFNVIYLPENPYID